MRTPILLFLTLFSLFVSCNKSIKQTRKFDLDSHSFLFFNEGSFWVYVDHDGGIDTITLVEVEQGYIDDKDGNDYVEYRIDKYWSSANQHFFTRESQDTTIYVFDSQFNIYKYRDIFKFTNKFHTYYSDVEKPDNFVDHNFFIDEINANININGVKHFGKSILTQASVINVPDSILDGSGNFIGYDTLFNAGGEVIGYDSSLVSTNFGAKTTYVDGIGMIQHINNTDSLWQITLQSYYLAPEE